MKNILYAFLFLLVTLSMVISGCGQDSSSEDDIAPQKPIIVPRSDDAIYPQRGVRPEPSQNSEDYWVRVEWQRNPEPDVKGYSIWRGTYNYLEGRRYRIADLEYGFHLPTAPEVTSHSWVDVGNGTGGARNLFAPILGEPQDYFWQIQAVDESGNLSEFSDTIRYTLIDNPYQTAVTREAENSYSLSWRYPISTGLNYKIRVFSNYYGRDSVMWDPPLFRRYTTQESVLLNEDGTAKAFERDCTYVWQLNAIRDEESSAAIITLFTYQD
jgi:hypothetical protein